MLYVSVLPLHMWTDFSMNRLAEVAREDNANTKSSIIDADLLPATTLFEYLDVDAAGHMSEQDLLDLDFSPAVAVEMITALDADGDRHIALFELGLQSIVTQLDGASE